MTEVEVMESITGALVSWFISLAELIQNAADWLTQLKDAAEK